MSAEVAALLAAASVAVLLTPGEGAVRLRAAVPAGQRSARAGPGRDRLAWRGRPGPGRPHPLARAPVRTAAAAVVVLVAGGGAVLALLAAGAVAAGGRWWASRTRAAAREGERTRAVEACTALAGELRAGRSPAQALTVAADLAVGPSRAALAAAAAAAGLGGDVPQALRPRPGDGCSVPEVLRALAACWTVCAGSGSGLAAAVERLADGLRDDRAQRRSVQSELAGPRATAGMLAVLPLAGLLLAAGLGADPLHVLLSTPVGLVCLVGGLGLDGLGLLWTGRLVRRAGGGG